MADSNPPQPPSAPAREAGKSLYEGTLDVLMTGVAIIVPFVVTLYVLDLALGFISDAFRPFVDLLRWLGVIGALERFELIRFLIDLGLYSVVVDFLTELIALVVLLGVVVLVGSVARNRYGERAIEFVDLAIASVPGVGTVYKSFRRMGDVMLDDGSENFQEVKLVQCLGDDLYLLGFETGHSPDVVGESTGHEEMVTMFVPLAPNPVTGGFLTYVPRSRVLDVDMTVEEGVRSILTSGVATDERAAEAADISIDDIGTITDIDRLQDVVPGETEGSRDGEEEQDAP